MSFTKATGRTFENQVAVTGWRSTLHTVMVLFKLRIVFLLLMAANMPRNILLLVGTFLTPK